jgi:lipopolysaccharide/colanic/teichoic acid biosynthesis glycosyltransferase
MSLVGPRPMMPEQVVLYPCTCYYNMRPGITGVWQVMARNNSSFKERAGFDARYYGAMSLWTDIKLLFATVRVVLRATGQ